MRSAAASYRLGLLLALGTALFLALGSGALGIIGDGRADRAYLAVLAVLAVGSIAARFRAPGMALVLLAAAVAQVVVPLALVAGGAPGTQGVSLLDVAGLTVLFGGMFATSAWLFRRAADREGRAGVGARS
ncbi:hypothetical protein [Oryzobacter telluris]|uniref:hypothetical protein n=1 Tax=Oryzobacter telluris TaxID=3149179 RepID=UPI00370DD06E